MSSASPIEQQQQWLQGLVTQQEWLDGRSVSPIANNLEADSGTVHGFMDDEQDHTCPICLELLLRPVQLSCSHHFCRGCWARVLQGRHARATAHLTGSVACPYRCEVRPVVPEVDETLASQLESHFAARYRERASSTSLPDEECRVTEVNEWAAQGCKLDDAPGADEVTTATEGRSVDEGLTRAVVVTSLFGGVLLESSELSLSGGVLLAILLLTILLGLILMIVCFAFRWSLGFNSTTMHILFALTGITATFTLADALLVQRMALALYTPARIATPPDERNALPESGRLGRLWSRMNLLLRTATRALASSFTSTRASTHAVVRRPAQAHAPQPQTPQLNEIAIVL